MYPDTADSWDRRCPGCQLPASSRRDFLRRSSLGFGWLAFAGLCGRWAGGGAGTGALAAQQISLHFAPRAKRVIFLFMDGGVSHVDSYDPKPELTRQSGQPAKWKPDPLSQSISAGRKWLGSPWEFQQHGGSGLWVSELF